jgi:hypothetical protein
MKWNIWLGKTYSRGRYYAAHVWPSVELSFIPGNRSFHIEAKWLLWDLKLNTFWPEDDRKYAALSDGHHRFKGTAEHTHCTHCGKARDSLLHLKPDDERVFTLCDLRSECSDVGSFTPLLYSVMAADSNAVVWQQQRRFPGVVFIEPSERALCGAINKQAWDHKPIGVLLYFVGCTSSCSHKTTVTKYGLAQCDDCGRFL